jgi:hypothetical protein
MLRRSLASYLHVAIVNALSFVNTFCSVLWAFFRDIVDFLSSEGHIYSTVDDEHYKATDSC